VAIRVATLLVKAYDIDPVMAGPPEVFGLAVMLTGSSGPEYGTYVQWAGGVGWHYSEGEERRHTMGNIFYIIGVVVVVLAILGYLGLR
jgi:hypothetical protein